MSNPGSLPLDLPLPLAWPRRELAPYLAHIQKNADRVAAVYYSLHAGPGLDARVPQGDLDTAAMLEILDQVPATATRHALLNAPFQDPARYADARFLDALAGRLATLADKGGLRGVVFGDYYLLRALSDAHPALAAKLTAVPGVNHGLRALTDVEAWLDAVGLTNFLPPDKLCLDRSLNRDLPGLERLSKAVRRAHPELRLTLLANEGCLARCPFRQAHGGHTGLAQATGKSPWHRPNRELGCSRLFSEEPWRLLASPLIRPEDAAAYAPHVDGLKLCGRTLGPGFLLRAARAYLDGAYAGSLLDLADSMEPLARVLAIPNAKLPPTFLKRTGRCGQACNGCAYCRDLADRLLRRLPPGLERLEPES